MAKRIALASQPSWHWLQIPHLDETLCSGCGWCCEVCPTESLAMAGPMPWMPRPDHCVGCGLCADVCPTSALRMAVVAAE